MQEVWDLLSLAESSDSPEESVEHLLLALSHDARMGSSGHHTIRFQGTFQGQSVVVLVDSGSSASFLAASLADQFPHLPRTLVSASVKIANGHILHCTSAILGCQFTLNGYQFQHDLKILQLDFYDFILGMDWLERYSPMQVHWKAKWLSLPYSEDTILLQGISALPESKMVFQLLSVDTQLGTDMSVPLLPEIQAILDSFLAVFTIPTALPPKRACDHAIPLISGASPVNVRAYRYPPSLKDEIEKQVNAMLSSGPNSAKHFTFLITSPARA